MFNSKMFMQKAFCAAAEESAAAGFACGSFRITMDAVLRAVSIFAILGLMAAGILVSIVGVIVLVAVGLLILGIGVATRSATAHCAF